MTAALELQDGLVAWTIDDSEFDRKLNRRVLTRSVAFAQIVDFPSAQDALDELRRIPVFPHVIFLDVVMPVKNGFDFLAEAADVFGESFASCVVIMLTSSLNPDDLERAQSFEAVQEFMAKPLTIDDMHAIAKKTVDTISEA